MINHPRGEPSEDSNKTLFRLIAEHFEWAAFYAQCGQFGAERESLLEIDAKIIDMRRTMKLLIETRRLMR